MSALQELARLDLEHRRALHPAMPMYAVPPAKFSDKTANELTRCIVRWFQINGHFATRLSSTGTYREDIKKFVASQQRRGLPDVFAVVRGRAAFVEIKVGKDRLSDDQREAIGELQASGAEVYISGDFEGFYDWVQGLVTPTIHL